MKKKLLSILTLLLCLCTGAWADGNTTLISGITLPSTPTTSYDLSTGNVVWNGTGASTKYLIKLDANGNAIMVGAAGGYGTTSAVRTFANAYNGSSDGWSTTGDSWEAPEASIFKGSTSYASGSTYDTQINVARRGNLRTNRTFAFRFTGAGGFSALVKSSGDTDARAAVLAVYQLNTSTGVLASVESKSSKTKAVDILTVDGLSPTNTYVAFIYGMDSNNGSLYEIAFLAQTKSVTSKVLTGININGSAWDISNLSDNAATITTAYSDIPEVEFVYTINYDDSSSDTNQKETVTATKDGDNYVAVSTVLTNNVTLTFTNVAAKPLPELSYAETAVAKLTTDANFINELTNPYNLTVTYSVEDGATATGVSVDASTGEVTIGSVPGTATIKASFDGNDDYLAGDASYVLTVTKPTCAVPTYSVGPYDYDHKGYKVTFACATEGATLKYVLTTANPDDGTQSTYFDGSELTYTKPIYITGKRVIIQASKDDHTTSYSAKGVRYQTSDAPTGTSPEVIGWNVKGNSEGEKNADHGNRAVTIVGGHYAQGNSSFANPNGLKLRLAPNSVSSGIDGVSLFMKMDVKNNYKVTKVTFDKIRENTDNGGLTINNVYVDGVALTDFKAISIPKSGTDILENVEIDLSKATNGGATSNVVISFARTNEKTTQYNAVTTVTYTATAETISTKSERNYGTYVTGYKLDFASAEGITAYIAKGLNSAKDAIVLQKVDVVPANEPIIVMTETKGASVSVPVTTDDPSDVTENALVAGDGTTAWDGTEGYTYYYLASDEFHQATSGTLQSGKAYLKVANGDVPTESRALGFVFDDEGTTTGISSTRNDMTNDKVVYDLQGRKINGQLPKGLYIVNGKKVVIK